MLDLLSIILLEDIKLKGAQYLTNTVQHELNLSDEEEKQLNGFWEYFGRFWLRKDIIDVWNIHNKDSDYLHLQNQTNNGLERYDHHMN